jgi:hypothetical protein
MPKSKLEIRAKPTCLQLYSFPFSNLLLASKEPTVETVNSGKETSTVSMVYKNPDHAK